jgi:hypothetical protein
VGKRKGIIYFAQIAACEIAKREDETQCQDVYTHPGLRGEYRVDW